MRFIITGRNMVVTEGLREAVEEKLGKLDKFFASETEVHVTLSVQKEQQKIEVTIPVKGHIIRSEQESNDMYVSIELVEEVIERQLKKYKNKLIDKKRNAADFAPEYVDEDEEIFEDEEVKIIRAKKFGIKPMNAEEIKEEVSNVLVYPSTPEEVTTSTNLTGKIAKYTLCIPKGDVHKWSDTTVEFFNKKWRTIGEPMEYIEELIPLSWNKKVMVECYE